MKLKNISIRFFTSLMSVAVVMFGGCSDDPFVSPDFTVSGEATTVTFELSVPQMTQVTRAALTEDQMNRVENVWVRTYSSATGEPTSEAKIITELSADEHNSHSVNLETKSGNSYIVAVANIDNMGCRIDPETGEAGPEQSLRELLKSADSWQEFLAITVKNPNLVSPDVPLAMSGCYLPETEYPKIEWKEQNFTPVFIPAAGEVSYTMPGAIHLRRLVAHVNFNLTPGPDVSIVPTSYRIFNVPLRAYAYERNTGGEAGGSGNYPNATDRVTEDAKEEHYTNSTLYDDRYFTASSDGSYSFDFWQLENKQTGQTTCQTYTDREKELKGDGGRNTGIYVNLSGDMWTPANMATYVEIQCEVNRRNGGQVNVDGDGNIIGNNSGENAYRYGNAIFTVHLGYCENKDANGKATAATAQDFNCRRNTNYNYNITVNDVSNIVVEANGEERQPGMEGVVNDVTNPSIELDCHYAAFNIQITDDERRSDQFGFTIEAWDEDGNLVSFTDGDGDLSNEQYANWIELRRTNNENTLAEYKPREGANADGQTMLLSDLKNAQSHQGGWYTVFVNEYVYETAANGDESNSVSWRNYVNKPERRFWIRTARSVSADGESIYARSKYAASQKSIQTYYSVDNLTEAEGNIPAGTAIGVENIDETRGLNLRQSTYGSDLSNGRYNVWGSWLEGRNNGSTADKKWNNVVDVTKPLTLPAVNAQGISLPERIAYLPKLANYGGSLTYNNYDPKPNSRNAEDYIEAINACMNRNRDNDGDGQIDASELRWYVPASGKYLRLILGRNSLSNPVMDYAGVKKLFSKEHNGHNSSLLMYASNNIILWAMEGVSTSAWGEHRSNPPWNVRCIRDLGTNLSTVTNGEKVAAAYKHDAATRTVKMTYYDELSIRKEKFESPLPAHYIWNADQSSNYNMVYKAFEYSNGSNEVTTWTGNAAKRFRYDWHGAVESAVFENNTPCSSLNTNGQKGWRVPNQKELAIMRNLGVFTNIPAGNYAASCTLEYYDSDGNGIVLSIDNRKRSYMATRSDGGTRIASGTNAYIRCVRDVEP